MIAYLQSEVTMDSVLLHHSSRVCIYDTHDGFVEVTGCAGFLNVPVEC